MRAPKFPLRCETAATYRGRPLVVRLHPRHLEIGEKRREMLSVPYDALYEFALKLRARAAALDQERRRA